MLMLSLETSHPRISATLSDGHERPESDDSEAFVRRMGLADGRPRGTSTLLTPMLESLFNRTDHEIQDLKAVAVSIGPGSFTGLRVGVVTAKSLAYATSAAIVGVGTMEVIAHQTAKQLNLATDIAIRVAINAQRQQLFVAHYVVTPSDRVELTSKLELVDRGPWLNSLKDGDVVTGTGLKPILDELPHNVVTAPESSWYPQSITVAKIAAIQFESGSADDLWSIEPIYFRPSAAEEKRMQR